MKGLEKLYPTMFSKTLTETLPLKKRKNLENLVCSLKILSNIGVLYITRKVFECRL